MGVDIWFAVERRLADGAWVRAEELEPGTRRREAWYDERNRELFFILAATKTPRPLSLGATIAQPRGLPSDVSDETRAEARGDFFGHSWLSTRELVAFDWQRRVQWEFDLVNDGPTRIDERDVVQHLSQYGTPPVGWHISGGSGQGRRVTAEPTCGALARDFMAVIVRMAGLAPDDLSASRCVFWFDE